MKYLGISGKVFFPQEMKGQIAIDRYIIDIYIVSCKEGNYCNFHIMMLFVPTVASEG